MSGRRASKARRSPGRFILDIGRGLRAGLRRPMSDLSARLNVACWSVLLLTSAAAVTIDVLMGRFGFSMWWNAGMGFLDACALRYALEGVLYRREQRALEEDELKFMETVLAGYGKLAPGEEVALRRRYYGKRK